MSPQKIKILKGSSSFFLAFCMYVRILFVLVWKHSFVHFFSSFISFIFIWCPFSRTHFEVREQTAFSSSFSSWFVFALGCQIQYSFILLFSCFRWRNSITKSGKLINIFLHEWIEKKEESDWQRHEIENNKKKIKFNGQTNTQMEY